MFSRRHCGKVCLVTWVTALILGIPDLVFATVRSEGGKNACLVILPLYMGQGVNGCLEMAEVLLGFLLPVDLAFSCWKLALVLKHNPAAYRTRKWKALGVLLTVVGFFVFTQLPYNAMKIYQAYNPVTHCGTSKALDQVAHVTESLALTHCCINPILYVFSCMKKMAKKKLGEKEKEET